MGMMMRMANLLMEKIVHMIHGLNILQRDNNNGEKQKDMLELHCLKVQG
jgi:hypothetical protein